MVNDLERFSNRFKEIGRGDVAEDLKNVLAKHVNTLPPYLPGAVPESGLSNPLTFFYYNPIKKTTEILPITQDRLEDPEYTEGLLKAILPLGLPEGTTNRKGVITRASSALSRVRINSANRKASIREIESMTDEEIHSSVRHGLGLGDKTIQFFRSAVAVLNDTPIP